MHMPITCLLQPIYRKGLVGGWGSDAASPPSRRPLESCSMQAGSSNVTDRSSTVCSTMAICLPSDRCRLPCCTCRGTLRPTLPTLSAQPCFRATQSSCPISAPREQTFPGAMPESSIDPSGRSEEHTSELQSLMRISYAVFCLKKKKKTQNKYQ